MHARTCRTSSPRPDARLCAPRAPRQITIKTLTGREQKCDFEPTQTILMIKQSLQEKEGIAVEQIRLIFGGKQLCVCTRACAAFDSRARAHVRGRLARVRARARMCSVESLTRSTPCPFLPATTRTRSPRPTLWRARRST
jgi:hypothetical protein